MQGTDPAAVAASTAQGWAYTLNTVARPAPEHLEAAQEALTALERADRPSGPLMGGPRWPGVRNALSEALTAARVRVDGGRPEVTVAQLTEAVGQLRELGLVSNPAGPMVPQFVANVALARADQRQAEVATRVEELEEELADLSLQLSDAEAEKRKLRDQRDRFERERVSADARTKAAHAGHSAAVAAAREDSRRASYRWVLAQLGNAVPGYDQMPTEELRELATKRLGEVNLESGALRHVAKELVRAGRRMALGLDGPVPKLDQDKPIPLASTVLELTDRTVRARGAALARQRELEEALEAERAERSEPSPDRWVGVLRERDYLRHRVAELEAQEDEG